MGIAKFFYKISRLILVILLLIMALLMLTYPFLQSWVLESIKLPNNLTLSVSDISLGYEKDTLVVHIPKIVLIKKYSNAIFAIAQDNHLKINLRKIWQKKALSISVSKMFINVDTLEMAQLKQENSQQLDYIHWIKKIKLNHILLTYKDTQSNIKLLYHNNQISINISEFDLSMLHLSQTKLPTLTIQSVIMLDEPNKFRVLSKIKNQDLDLEVDFISQESTQTLRATSQYFAVNRLKKYLPRKYLSPAVTTWLNEAFIDGIGRNITLDLVKNPDNNYLFTFKADFEQVELNFDNKWPNLQASGQIEINDDDINIQSTNGKIANLSIESARIDINDIAQSDTVLIADIWANNKSQSLLDFLTIKPLEKYSSGLPPMALSGHSKTKINLIIPLADANITDGELGIEVKVDNKFINNQLFLGKREHTEITEVDAGLTLTVKLDKSQLDIKGQGNVLDNVILFSILDKEKKFTAALEYKKAQLILNSQHKQNQWQAKLTNQNSEIKAVVTPDFDQYVMEVAIESANIVSKKTTTKKHSFNLIPEDVPKIFLTSKEVRINDYLLPDLDLVITPSVETVSVSGRAKINDNLSANLKGFWIYDEYQRSKVTINIQSNGNHLADLLSLIDASKTVSEAKFRLNIDLFCECKPWLLNVNSLKGYGDIDIKSGVLNGQNTGIGDLLSALSIRSLGKQLSIDTSELNDQGFAFQNIKAKASLKANEITLSHFKLSSLASYIDMSGSTNLKTHHINFKAKVTPALSDSVPVLTLLTGGGLAGFGLWLVDKATFNGKILETLLDKNAVFDYNITGDWHEPNIK